MKQLNILIIGLLAILFFACADENQKPIITFEDAGKGAYPRLLSESEKEINLYDIDNSSYVYSVEFVDVEQGALVATYELDLAYEDVDGTNSVEPLSFRTYTASDLEVNADGFMGLENITVTAKELMNAAGLTLDQLSPGDNFEVTGRVTTQDGQTFTSENSSAAVKSDSFRGMFDYKLEVGCPTHLAGTYSVITTNTWCDGDVPFNTEVTLELTSTGYSITDFTFGAYDVCVGPSSAKPGGSLRMVDICNKISITGASQWSDIYTWGNLVVDGENLSFDWENDFGESGSATIIRPGGWPPLELD